jgi:hypothetical protein
MAEKQFIEEAWGIVAHLSQEIQVGLRFVGVEDDVTLRMTNGFCHGGRVA